MSLETDARPRRQHVRRDARAVPPARAARPDPRQRATSRRSARRARACSSRSRCRCVWPVSRRRGRARSRRSSGCAAPPCSAIDDGHNVLILSDRGVDAEHVAIPALLALSAVQQHLVREGIRMQVGLVVETAEVREVHDVALLIGYGAAAVNPYLALDTVASWSRWARPGPAEATALHPRDRGGPAQGDVQDGHLDGAELPRRADLRGGRARPRR